MATVPIGAPALVAKVKRIGDGRTQVIGGAAVNRLGQAIGPQNGQAVTEALGYLRLEAVVPATEIIPQQVALGSQNTGLENDAVVNVLVRRGRSVQRRVDEPRRIVCAESFNFDPYLACICGFDHQAGSNLALDREIERLDIGSPQAGFSEDAANRKGELRTAVPGIRCDLGAAELAGGDRRRCGEADRSERILNPATEGRTKAGKRRVFLGQRVCINALEEHAITASHTRFAVAKDIPGEADTGSEVVQIRVRQTARQVAREEHANRRVGHHGGLLAGRNGIDPVVLLHPREERLVAYSQSDGQTRGHLEFILEKRRVRIGQRVRISDTEIELEVVESPQHEIRHRVAGPRAREIEARRTDEDLTELEAQKLIAELEMMPATDPVHGVAELPVMTVKARREAGAKSKIVAHVHGNRSAGQVLRHVDTERFRIDG